jgi:hypothetical protein
MHKEEEEWPGASKRSKHGRARKGNHNGRTSPAHRELGMYPGLPARSYAL